MGSENEPAKLLLPYLQRADELQKHEPLVAYYCRLYAMERGMKIPQGERTKTTTALLISLMNQLEKDKKSLKLGPEDSFHVEGFALNVFAKADKQDRAGRADLNTAKTFYAASIFFEILNQFGPLQPDLEQKHKYAVWKAADIRKALKEGRTPIPGPPSWEEDLTIPSNTPNGGYDLGASESTFGSHGPESVPSPNFKDAADYQHYSNKPPSPKFHDSLNNQSFKEMPPPSHFHDQVNNQYSTISPSSQPYPSGNYSTHDFHQSDPSSRTDNHYPESYNHQLYPQEYQHHIPTNYPSHESSSSYPLPHFQSYPSFTESTVPSVPSNYPSYYQGSESSTYPQRASQTTSYSPSAEQNSRSQNGSAPEPISASSHSYQYDPNYQPSPEKVAEAHKAARFAVGALAFDEVSVAVDYLRKSLELLTNPSSGH